MLNVEVAEKEWNLLTVVEVAGTQLVEDGLTRVLEDQADVDVGLAVFALDFIDFLKGPGALAVLSEPDLNQAVEHVHIRLLEM